MMSEQASNPIYDQVEAIYRAESRRVFATLIRLLGDFDLAEEAVQTAFAAALEQWPREGMPANPRAWLVSTGRFKGIDVLRRQARFDGSVTDAMLEQLGGVDPAAWGPARSRGRPPAPHLHLLPSRISSRCAGGSDAA